MKMIKKETKLVERLFARVRLHLLLTKSSYKQVTSMHSKKKKVNICGRKNNNMLKIRETISQRRDSNKKVSFQFNVLASMDN